MTAFNSRLHESYATNELFTFLDGKAYTLDGIHGTFRQDVWVGLDRVSEYLRHVPSAQGKRSKAYQDTKRQLGDDWSTDLTNGLRYVDIAIELGYSTENNV